MRVSVHVMLDSIRRYRHESHLPETVSFRRVALLPRRAGEEALRADCLYVGFLSDALRIRRPGFICFCLRDRERDETETDAALAGLLIVEEAFTPEYLFNELQDLFARLNDWYEDMQNAVILKKTVQDIIDMSERIIGNFISVSDSALALIAYTKNIPTDDPISLFLIENGYHSEEAFRKFRKFRRFETWTESDGLIVNTDRNIAKYTVISKVFTFGELYFAHVVMSCTHREATPGLLYLFSCLAEILGHCVKREWDAEKAYNHEYNSLIADLMDGRITEAGVRERARIVGIQAEDKYIVMLPAEGPNKASFPERMTRDLARAFRNIRSVYFNTQPMFFLHRNGPASFFDETLAHLDEYFHENNIHCGASDIFDDLLELPDAYRQAECALSEGAAARPNRGGLARFDAHYARCLLDKTKRAARLLETSRYGKMLLYLRRTDDERRSNNFEVLRTYLCNERRAAETAAALHMHRNNVVYRVDRIEKMLGIDLEDWQTRKNLLLSFIAMGEA
ncbi:MAG: helix-turn-helix domain-containing protein [Clostridiales Family XIII bacterium]|nr:helix-turn-helix domain-containing protein [Clostridiales Family XIII bacterium]